MAILDSTLRGSGQVTFPPINSTVDNLPLGRFKTTFDVVEDHYVSAFPGSSGRRELFDALVMSTEALQSAVPVLSVWLAGSFVSPRAKPTDVDVTYWVDFDDLKSMTADDRLTFQPYNIRGGLKSANIPIDAFVKYWHPYEPGGVRPSRVLSGYDYLTDRGTWDDAWSRMKSVGPTGEMQLADRPNRGYLEVIPDNGSTW